MTAPPPPAAPRSDAPAPPPVPAYKPKPCPFCGCDGAELSADMRARPQVACDGCGACAPIAHADGIEAAYAAWDRRSPSPSLSARATPAATGLDYAARGAEQSVAIDDMQKHIDSLTRDLAGMHEAFDKRLWQVDRLKTQRNDANAESDSLRAELAKLRGEGAGSAERRWWLASTTIAELDERTRILSNHYYALDCDEEIAIERRIGRPAAHSAGEEHTEQGPASSTGERQTSGTSATDAESETGSSPAGAATAAPVCHACKGDGYIVAGGSSFPCALCRVVPVIQPAPAPAGQATPPERDPDESARVLIGAMAKELHKRRREAVDATKEYEQLAALCSAAVSQIASERDAARSELPALRAERDALQDQLATAAEALDWTLLRVEWDPKLGAYDVHDNRRRAHEATLAALKARRSALSVVAAPQQEEGTK